ncbi:hypothetical protein JCM5353_000395 [Sporobolomyces roseus]
MHLTSLSLVFLALSSASSTLASPGSFPGKTPDGLIWKRYEPPTSVPPPPHPAELAPRSPHRSHPSRYASHAISNPKTDDSQGEGGGKRRMMGYKQVTAQEVRKRALEKQERVGKRVYFEVVRRRSEESEGDDEVDLTGEEEDDEDEWSWVEEETMVVGESVGEVEEKVNVEVAEESWSRKMEKRMKEKKPLFNA